MLTWLTEIRSVLTFSSLVSSQLNASKIETIKNYPTAMFSKLISLILSECLKKYFSSCKDVII